MRRALEEELASSATPADWTVALVDRAGLILARSRAHEEFVGTPANRSLQDATREGQEGTWRGTTLEGRPIHGAFARSRLADWRVAVGVPEAVLTAPLRRSLLLLLTLGAGLAGLSAALALWLGGRVALPIGALADRAAALGRGEAVAPLLTPVREVNRVAAELESASASLGEREAALRASEARLRAILETVPVGVVIAEAPSGRIVEGNKQAERVFGHPVLPSAGVEDYREWVSHHPDGREVAPSEYPLSRVVRGGEERAELEVLYLRGDESEAWVRLIAAPIRDEAGRTRGGVVACLDVDREKRAEAGLRRLNEELEARVAERTRERDRMWRLSTDLMLVAGFDGTVAAVNPAWTALLGWAEDELLWARFIDFVHPDDVARTEAEAGTLADGAPDPALREPLPAQGRVVPLAVLDRGAGRGVHPRRGARRHRREGGAGRAGAGAGAAPAGAEDGGGGAAHRRRRARLQQPAAGDPGQPRPPAAARAGRATSGRTAPSRPRRRRPSAAPCSPRGCSPFRAGRRSIRSPWTPTSWWPGCRSCCGARSARRCGSRPCWPAGCGGPACDPHQLENALLNLAVNARDAMPDGAAG